MSDNLPVPTKDTEKFASIVSHGAALVSVTCLTAALLYNVILFFFIDTVLITAFTISDHIATAIEMLPIVFLMVAYALLRNPIPPDNTRQAWRWLIGLPILGLVGWLIYSWLGMPAEGGMLFGMCIPFAWLAGGEHLVRTALAASSRGILIAVRVLGALFALVAYQAVGMGVALADPRATHVLTLAGKEKMNVHLIQILERGVVLVSVPDRVAAFIPKDEVKRIEKIKK